MEIYPWTAYFEEREIAIIMTEKIDSRERIAKNGIRRKIAKIDKSKRELR